MFAYCTLYTFPEQNTEHFWCPVKLFTSEDPLLTSEIHSTPSVTMVGVKRTDLAPTAAVKVIGAGTAACFADLVTFPLDTAKVRLQVSY